MNKNRALNFFMESSLVFLLLSMIIGQYSIFLFYHQTNFHELMTVSEDLLRGITHLRVYQNRILGPAIIKLMQMSFCDMGGVCDYAFALKAYHFIMIFLVNSTVYLFSRSIFKTLINDQVLCFMARALAVVFVSSYQTQMLNAWMQPWDYLDVLGFTILLCADINRDRSLVFFWFLFAIWMPAKESAMFVPFWLFLTRLNLSFSEFFSFRNLYQKRVVIIQIFAMMIISVVMAKVLRDAMWVHSNFGAGTDDANKVLGNLIGVVDNYRRIKVAVIGFFQLKFDGWFYGSVYHLAFSMVFIILRIRTSLTDPESRHLSQVLNFSLLFLGMLWCLGSTPESRLNLPLIPIALVTFAHVLGYDKKRYNNVG